MATQVTKRKEPAVMASITGKLSGCGATGRLSSITCFESCSLFYDLRWRRNHDLWPSFVKLYFPRDGDWIVSQGFEELLASYCGNILRRNKSSEDLLRVSLAEIDKGVALLGKAYLLDKAANAGVFADVIFRLLWQNGRRVTADARQQKDSEQQWL
jgi:hypothetical protein